MKKILGLLAGIAFLAGPSLSAHCPNDCNNDCFITGKDVRGTYTFSGFSNSLDGAGTPAQPQSQAVVGQAKFRADGTGTLTIADFVIVVGGSIIDIHRENVPFTYTLGPIDGYGTITVPDFPVAGTTPTFAVVFKKHKGKIYGIRLLTIASTPVTSRWTLLEGERFD